MGLSTVLDKKYKNQTSKKDKSIACLNNVLDCRFIDGNGNCKAEWCIFNELPEMVQKVKQINCIICNKPKEVSVYCGETNYICEDCKKIIDKVFKNPTCGICGASTVPGQAICQNCAVRLKELLNE